MIITIGGLNFGMFLAGTDRQYQEKMRKGQSIRCLPLLLVQHFIYKMTNIKSSNFITSNFAYCDNFGNVQQSPRKIKEKDNWPPSNENLPLTPIQAVLFSYANLPCLLPPNVPCNSCYVLELVHYFYSFAWQVADDEKSPQTLFFWWNGRHLSEYSLVRNNKCETYSFATPLVSFLDFSWVGGWSLVIKKWQSHQQQEMTTPYQLVIQWSAHADAPPHLWSNIDCR